MTDQAQEEHRNPRDLVARAKQQLAAATANLQKGVGAVKDPARRRELTVSYVELMQRYLDKAQQNLEQVKARQQEPSADPTERTRSAEGAGSAQRGTPLPIPDPAQEADPRPARNR